MNRLRHWLQIVIALTLILGFIALADEISETDDDLHRVDQTILSFLETKRSPLITQSMTDLTALGSLSVITVLAVITLSLLASLGDRLGIVHLLVVVTGTATVPRILKNLFDRPRPDVVDALAAVSDSSFPSGHAFAATAVYLTLAFFASRHRKNMGFEVFFLGIALIVIFLVGFSRTYLGVHYPSDVLGGTFAGSAWALLVASAFLRFYSNEAPGRGTK